MELELVMKLTLDEVIELVKSRLIELRKTCLENNLRLCGLASVEIKLTDNYIIEPLWSSVDYVGNIDYLFSFKSLKIRLTYRDKWEIDKYTIDDVQTS